MKKLGLLLLLLLLLAGVFAGCAAPSPSSSYAEAGDAAPEAPAEDAAEESSGLGDLEAALAQADNRKLVYTASIVMTTEDFAGAYSQLADRVAGLGGYISYEETRGTEPTAYGDTGRHSELTVKIPVEHYEAFLGGLSEIGEIESKSQTTEDITSQYYDVDARIEMLEGRYERLKEHLEAATAMEDIIALEEEISQVLLELDTLKGERRGMDYLVEYSTVNISLREVVRAGAVSASDGSVGQRAGDSFQSTWQGIGVFFQELAVVLAGAAPVLILLAAAGGIVWVVIIILRRRKRKKEQ